jgi:hypothetical protein
MADRKKSLAPTSKKPVVPPPPSISSGFIYILILSNYII